MRTITFLGWVAIGAFALLGACKSDNSMITASSQFVANSFGDSVALAHGFDNWQNIDRLDFSFEVKVNDTIRTNRNWVWYPKMDSVIRSTDEESISLIRNTSLSEAQTAADGQFINDSYWLLMPYYLVWSEGGYTPTIERGVVAPLSKETMNKLTVAYADQGGYTPGDAYDLYVDKDYNLREWTFRKGGQDAPSMIMSWDDYRDLKGLVLPTTHVGEGPVQISHPLVAAYVGMVGR